VEVVVEEEVFRMLTRRNFRKESGQAIAEFTICLIGITVLFLGILLFGDLCRARLNTMVTSRMNAGANAMAGIVEGSPTYFGSADSQDRLKSEVLSASEDPIAYSQFTSPVYGYMKQNLVAPLYDSSTPIVSTMNLTKSEETQYVTNAEGLVNLKVGQKTIPITQSTTMPTMEGWQ
jgi:hypothetical protein